ncbi:hypothetical protein [Nostoc sp. C117]|uniref:hypothetical protein n=1 Tax=Nostoc sp. C117 TaxID=3349875 RepID=UPI00370DA7C6
MYQTKVIKNTIPAISFIPSWDEKLDSDCGGNFSSCSEWRLTQDLRNWHRAIAN